MPILGLLCVLAILFFGAGLFTFALLIFGSLWRGAEALMHGVIGGVWLFWRLVCACCRAWRAVWRLCKRVGLWMAQKGYAMAYGGGYRLRRAFIARELRARRERA